MTVSAREVTISAVGYAPFIVSHGVHPWSAYIVTPLEEFILYEAPKAIGQAVIRALAASSGASAGVRLG